jgi:DNA-binding CsgD family transcriptional regulator
VVISAEKQIMLSSLAVAAAMDPGQWQPFLDEMGQILGTRVCTQLIGYDQLTKAAPLAYSSGYDPEILHLYETHYADKNPFAANFQNCGIGESISAHELCEPEKLKKTDFYADLLQPLEDIYGGGGSMLALDANRMFLIGGNIRAKDRETYEEDWLRLCVGLAPVIRQSLEINRAISGLSFEKWAAEQHLLGTGTAIFVVDPTMMIHYTCKEAEKLLGGGALVESGIDRRIRFPSEEAQNRFLCLTRSQARGEMNVLNSWRLTDKTGQGWTCRVMGMRLGDLDRSPFQAFLTKSISAVLLAIKPDITASSFQTDLQNALGLSRAETASALMLSDGQSLAEIAETRRVSIYTVRNQIKSAMAKTGCRRQSELVRRIEQLRQQGGR